MPIYEYQCAHCGHQLEALQKVSDAPLTQCPVCKSDSLEKQMSSSQFQLKGNGWYVTDFRDKKPGEDKPATTSSPSTSDSSQSSEAGNKSSDTSASSSKSDTTSSSSSSED